MSLIPPADLYCCGDRRGLLLPLLLTCSTVLLTSSWPTCSIPLAELVLIMVGLFSRGKLLSASAACNRKRLEGWLRLGASGGKGGNRPKMGLLRRSRGLVLCWDVMGVTGFWSQDGQMG